jgi:L,D-transpeptidase ErfK/SrfK
VGTDVHIVNQPYLAGWQDGVLHLEAHAPLAEDAKRWQGSLAPMEKVLRSASTDAPDAVDWEQAQTVARAARGLPVPVGAGSPDPDQVIAAARRAPRVPPWAEPLPQPD